MDIAEFEGEVEAVLDGLPKWVRDRMDNVYVIV
jgi:predicted Zn-dependent protease with MMP-like domain